MSIKHGKTPKTLVKVFHLNIGDIEQELNKWIKEYEDAAEIDDIKLSFDNQNKAVVIVVYHPIVTVAPTP
jgi:hypothetical protein